MTNLNDLEIEAARLQAVFDAELEHMRLEAAVGNITPETAEAVADAAKELHTAEEKIAESATASKPDGTSKLNLHDIPEQVVEAAKQAAFKVTVNQLTEEGLDRQSNEPIAITFSRKQSQAIRACQELIGMDSSEAKGRTHQEFVSDCVVSVLKSTIARTVREMLKDAEIHVINLDEADDEQS